MIKNMTDTKNLGWDWSNDLIEVADSIYNQQIPKSWCLMSGSKTHFPNYSLSSFFNDLSTRFQHIEKCLNMVSK
jgi:hypothetical protein